MIQAAKVIQENIVVNEKELELPATPELICKIVKLMPVIYLKDTKNSLINLHEFVMTPGAFEYIMLQDDEDEKNKPADENEDE